MELDREAVPFVLAAEHVEDGAFRAAQRRPDVLRLCDCPVRLCRFVSPEREVRAVEDVSLDGGHRARCRRRGTGRQDLFVQSVGNMPCPDRNDTGHRLADVVDIEWLLAEVCVPSLDDVSVLEFIKMESGDRILHFQLVLSEADLFDVRHAGVRQRAEASACEPLFGRSIKYRNHASHHLGWISYFVTVPTKLVVPGFSFGTSSIVTY